MKTKLLNRLIAFVLLFAGLCSGQVAWAVTETLDFNEACWGITPNNYASGSYYAYGYVIESENIKYNTYDNCIILNYYYRHPSNPNNNRDQGTITLPTFSGTISAIRVYTINAISDKTRYISLNVNGVKQGENKSVIPNAANYETPAAFTGLSIASGSIVMLRNETDNEFHILKIEVDHDGSKLGTNTESDGLYTVSAEISPAGAGTVTISPERSELTYDFDVDVLATANSGYQFSGWTAYKYANCEAPTQDNSLLYMGTTEAENLVMIPYYYNSSTYQYEGMNVRLIATFEEVSTYTITYNKTHALCVDDDTWPTNQSDIAENTVITLPTGVELEGVDGYTFVGWTTNSSYTNSTTAPSPLYTASVTVTSNLTLYPVFSVGGTSGSSVTFNRKNATAMEAGYYVLAYGQSGDQQALGPELNTTTYKLDTKIVTVTNASASVSDQDAMWQVAQSGTYWTIKNVYTNKYVALRRDGSSNILKNKVDMISSVTNDAKWIFEIQGDHYYVKSAADDTYFLRYYGSEKVWNINNGSNPNNSGGSIYLYKATTTPGATTTTYTINPSCVTHTLTYDSNGASAGTVPASPTAYAEGKSVTVKGNSGELTKTGYDFNGWKADNASSGTAYAAGSSITMNADHTLYAQWTAHTINLVLDANTANGGATDGSATVKYNSTALEAGTVHAIGTTGKTLTGYFSAPTAGNKVLNADGTFAATAVTDYITASQWTRDESSTTLHAQWRQNTYTVVFNKNVTGPSGSMANQNFTYGTAQNLTTNSYTWPAHNFEGWATEEGSSTVVYGNGAEVNNLTAEDGGTVNLYAVWTDKTYNDYKFTCVDIALTTEDVNPVLVTSRQGINIMAKKKLILTVDGTTGPIDLTSENDVLHFYKKTTSAPIRYVELTGANRLTAPVTEQEVYVSYQPNTVGTGDFEYPSITVAQGANVRHYPGKVQARNLPDDVAIVARVGESWFALPANISTAATPEPVPVTVAPDGGILKATGPSTLSYKLWPVATTNSALDRFGTATGYTPAVLYADRMRFAGSDNKGLWMNNNTSASTIKNDGAITAVGTHFATDAAYEWDVTTTLSDDNFVYNLKAENGTNTYFLRMKEAESKWGTYASGNTNELYILPLIVKQTPRLTIMEWGENELAVSYPNAASATAITAKIGTGGATAVTKTALSGDIYRLTGVGNLAANAGKLLTIDITESGESKQLQVRIPLIVTSTKNLTELRALLPGSKAEEQAKEAQMTDVAVRQGGKLQTTGSSAAVKFNNIYIYPGGKMDVTDASRLTINQLFLRGGFSWLDSPEDFRLPNVYLTETFAGSQNIIFDYYIDNRKFYWLALPFDVSVNDVSDEVGYKNFSSWVAYYDGAARAEGTHTSGWKDYTGAPNTYFGDDGLTLKTGIGYNIAAKPRKKFGGVSDPAKDRSYAIVRFPLNKNSALAANEGDKSSITVTAHGIEALNAGTQTANNVGWNLVGNPYMSAIGGAAADGATSGTADITVGRLVETKPDDVHWDGTYHWVEQDVRYVTLPNLIYDEYTQVKLSEATIPAFTSFFIQTETTGTLSFSAAARRQLMPKLQAHSEEQELSVDLVIEHEDKSDLTGILFAEHFTEDYEIGADLEKMAGDNQMTLYSLTSGYELAFNALPERLAQEPLPLGFTAAEDGEYTIRLKESADTRFVESIILIDYEQGGQLTDLMVDDYTFDAVAQKHNNTRFALSVRMRQNGDIGTSAEQLTGALSTVSTTSRDGTLVLHSLPANTQVFVYDMTGKLITTTNTTSASERLTYELPRGVYNIRVIQGTEGRTIRVRVE